jgi:hypothetical protein
VFAHEKHFFFSSLISRHVTLQFAFHFGRHASHPIGYYPVAGRPRDARSIVESDAAARTAKLEGKASFRPGNDTPRYCEAVGCLRQSREQLERRWAIGRCYLEKYSPSMWRGAMLCRYAAAVSVRCTNHRTCPCMAFACVATRERARELDDVCSRGWLHRYRRSH